VKREYANDLLPRVLRAMADGERLDNVGNTDIGAIEWLVRGGLGPLLHRLRPADGFTGAPGAEALLHGADLTSRVLTADLTAAVDEIVTALRCSGTEPILLKGMSFASRYYDEPHLRIMGDVDILVPHDAIDRSVEAVRRLGFETVEGAGHLARSRMSSPSSAAVATTSTGTVSNAGRVARSPARVPRWS
jgi:hypothetical protein